MPINLSVGRQLTRPLLVKTPLFRDAINQAWAIAAQAKAANAHVVGLSILSGSHLDLVRETIAELRKQGLGDVPLVVGGIIPPEDGQALRQMGVARIYTPKDFKITGIMSDVVKVVEKAWLVKG